MDEETPRLERPWIDVARLVRRACFLRLEGNVARSQEIEQGELAAAVASARESAPSVAEADRCLARIRHEEERRVADALALSEILVPRLAACLSAGQSAKQPQLRPAAALSARSAPGNGGIADFIDQMLTQDRSARR